MIDFKSLSSNQRFVLNILVPLSYLFPLVLAYLGPKNFGFGFPGLVYAGLSVGAVGVLLWIAATWTLGSSLAVLPGTDQLVTKGVYRVFRHPIYVGIVLTLTGLFIACGSALCLVYVLVVVIPLNIFRARAEEQVLLQQLGPPYQRYRDSTIL
ncbi:MAG: isoprenylcysteine carboxylmethyltransferase family protein [Nitrospinaceae bacterium]|jgi:protein-S-isoprenylcysteine O-methyltransferase Ste14|nr:isoprenylcysteine carboxylmethyltransferase family protein [Nitrospina sp.]MBT5376707.1 isoprenylcysteine carboxylmethyltransferase family protein [Nitrospinaceae bacterium]MBT5868906.1 isoprenylcysteine carboxylmethyltransferase family protein [Nitrospinaceae bacterium]MBT6345887.1 isoprenylcysteine carboxylmethyltransferase family protein [Nitrospina sp.]